MERLARTSFWQSSQSSSAFESLMTGDHTSSAIDSFDQPNYRRPRCSWVYIRSHSFLFHKGWPDCPHCAETSKLTQPSGTPIHAIGPGEGLRVTSSCFPLLCKGAVWASFTARIGRAPFCNAPSKLVRFHTQEVQPGWFQLRASNEGLLRPRVARAQETNRPPDLSFPDVLWERSTGRGVSSPPLHRVLDRKDGCI